MSLLVSLVSIVIGFVLLIKGADFFVDGAASVAAKAGIPQIVIGLTIVAFGTSAPEAAVSIGSAIKGSDGISIGNVLGSNIMNILVILGITAIICNLPVKKTSIRVDMPVMIGLSVILFVFGYFMKCFNVVSGIVFLAIIAIYIVYLVRYSIKNGADDDTESKNLSIPRIVIYIIGGLCAIVYGSDLTVDGASYVASCLGVSDRIIGLTVVAFGTSLPELVTSVTAARKNNTDIAVGNIVGSNIFNIAFVLGTTSIIRKVPFSEAFYFDGIVSIIAAVLLWILTFRKCELNRAGGVCLFVGYVAYFIAILIH